MLSATPVSASGAQTRSRYSWPFARTSIWNTPIGTRAVYVPARIKLTEDDSGQVAVDPEYISVDPTSPVRPLNSADGDLKDQLVHVDPSISHDGSWNGCATFLRAGGTHITQGQPLTLAAGGDPTWKYTFAVNQSLTGDGIKGCHGGSVLSGIGGSLRQGELSSRAPIRHVLKVNLYARRFLSPRNAGHRWPAERADSYYAEEYGGTNRHLVMGSLLALPPGTDLSFITNPRVRKLAIALRDYGAYVVDDTYWDVHAFAAEHDAEFAAGRRFHYELQRVMTRLSVVTNNSPRAIGGPGRRRGPWAPPFESLPAS